MSAAGWLLMSVGFFVQGTLLALLWYDLQTRIQAISDALRIAPTAAPWEVPPSSFELSDAEAAALEQQQQRASRVRARAMQSHDYEPN